MKSCRTLVAGLLVATLLVCTACTQSQIHLLDAIVTASEIAVEAFTGVPPAPVTAFINGALGITNGLLANPTSTQLEQALLAFAALAVPDASQLDPATAAKIAALEQAISVFINTYNSPTATQARLILAAFPAHPQKAQKAFVLTAKDQKRIEKLKARIEALQVKLHAK